MAQNSTMEPPVSGRDHVLGPESARVTLVEYGDFECPHCAIAYPLVKELHQRFGDRVRFVFRHFPLTNVHPHAQAAAEASEFAAAGGVFWQMHDILFEQQKQLADGQLTRLAAGLKLDQDALSNALRDHTFLPRVKEDFLGGIKSGVKGTPAFFINERRHDGDAASLGPAIEQALARH